MRPVLREQSGPISWLASHALSMMRVPQIPHEPMTSPLIELRPIYTIDAHDRIVDVNRAFIESLPRTFAISSTDAVIGRSIWDFVPGCLPRKLWAVLYERVRAIGAPVFVPMRLDTSRRRRLVDVELHAVGDRSVRHVLQWIWSEPRAPVALLDPTRPRDARVVTRCAWCARIQVRAGAWQDVEQAQATLNLDCGSTQPSVRDGACTSCKQSVLKTFPARVARFGFAPAGP